MQPIEKRRPQTQGGEDRQKNRDVLQVEPTQCIWTDIDTNKRYLIDNKGGAPVFVNQVGQIPSRFTLGVTGVINYATRDKLSKDKRLPADQALAIKYEKPKSLANYKSSRAQYYTPVQQKVFGYSQIPRQLGLPYQNQMEYQKLLKRHLAKGLPLPSFEFPQNQGKEFKDKTEATEKTLNRYSNSAANRAYGKHIGLRLRNPDQTIGFKDEYLSGTHIGVSRTSKASSKTFDTRFGRDTAGKSASLVVGGNDKELKEIASAYTDNANEKSSRQTSTLSQLPSRKSSSLCEGHLSNNQFTVLQTMKSFLQRQNFGSKKKTDESSADSDPTSEKKVKKFDKPLDAKRMGDLIGAKNGLKNNVPGATINGNPLSKPVTPYRNPKLHEDEEQDGSPESKDLDLMFQSFRPGMTSDDRYKLQDQTQFYRSQFPSSAYQTRLDSFAYRVASARKTMTAGFTKSSADTKKSSMQATFKDMKEIVNKEQSMTNYNIKSKHQNEMTCFLASKNFELRTSKPSPPVQQPNKTDPKAAQDKKQPTGAKTEQLRRNSTGMSEDSEIARTLVVAENIENDKEELYRQDKSSWAQRQGFPIKAGLVMSHGVTIQKNELNATKAMRETSENLKIKVKTKGRFHVEIPTNGLLNRTDMLWAQRANPVAHEAQIHRDLQDIKMLQKKKESREMSSNLWSKKGKKGARPAKTSNVRTSQASVNSLSGAKRESNKSVGFSQQV